MKASLNWLSDWVDVGSDVKALAHALTMAGLEIEGLARPAPESDGVVVAEVLSTTRHPDADKLSVCSVSDGTQILQIVCGAPNVRAGLKAPLAKVGATLPGGLNIKTAKLRGVESFGMLCSARELGLPDPGIPGLLELAADSKIGESLTKALQLDDWILEVNLTPNRGDCLSVRGIAREIAILHRAEFKEPACTPVPATLTETFPVSIQAPGCGKLVSRVIRGVKPNVTSPWWLQERLRRAGLRPVNAVVDVTNYVMLELGQPMHAYDLGELRSGIVVRQARQDESLTLLDGRNVSLTPDVLLIADRERALGLAGIMGGAGSSITATTTDVLFEAAHFEPSAIAGRGRRYGLVTDASQRFERGVDAQLQERATERATQLLLEIAGGQAGPVQVTQGQKPLITSHPSIQLRNARITRLLGHMIPATEVERILISLGMVVVTQAEEQWSVLPPSWRFDINIEQDLIEEVARIYGYDHIPGIAAQSPQTLKPCTESRITLERCATALVDRGYQEAITYSFTDPALQALLFPGQSAATLLNPISSELGVMRLSAWPGLLQSLQTNLRRQQQRVRLFETGRRFSADGKEETDIIAGLISGDVVPEQWGSKAQHADFLDVKSDVENLLQLTAQGARFKFIAATHSALHPGQTARILRDEVPVGWLGVLHPELARKLDLVAPVVLFELDTRATFSAQVPEYKEISKFPEVRRDLALLVDQQTGYDTLRTALLESAGELLKELTLFDVYQGPGVENGKKSMALALKLQDTSRTLTDAEVDAVTQRVVAHLAQRLNARLRDK